MVEEQRRGGETMANRESMSGAETLRAVVGWIDWQHEGFNERFSPEQLIALWRYGQAHDREVDEFADTWTPEQITEALRDCPEKAEPEDVER
jgi:hypothetical protein